MLLQGQSYPRDSTCPQADSAWCDSESGRSMNFVASEHRSGNGRKLLVTATAEAACIRKDGRRQAAGRAIEGRSVRQRRKPMPLPLSNDVRRNRSLRARNRERDLTEVRFEGTPAGDLPRPQGLGGKPEREPNGVARLRPGPDPPGEKRHAARCGGLPQGSEGWWQHQPSYVCSGRRSNHRLWPIADIPRSHL